MNRNDKTHIDIKKLEKIAGRPLTLGSLLLSIRLGEEMSQVEFAKLLGVSKQFLCDLEHDRRVVSPKRAGMFAKKTQYSEKQFIRLALQDALRREGFSYLIELKVA